MPSDPKLVAKKSKSSFMPCVIKIMLIGAFLCGISYYLGFVYFNTDKHLEEDTSDQEKKDDKNVIKNDED